jgi:hypothetical protein
MPAKNYASTRFSGMEEITTANVANLKVSFTFSTGVLQGHEAAPLVIHTMYIVTPYPNYLYALDLTRTGGPVKCSFTVLVGAGSWTRRPAGVRGRRGLFVYDSNPVFSVHS